jgi:hypothetical protein
MQALKVNDDGVAVVHIEALKLLQLLTADDDKLRREVATIIVRRVQGERSAGSLELAGKLLSASEHAHGGLRNLRLAYAQEDSATWWARRNLAPDDEKLRDPFQIIHDGGRLHRHSFAPDLSPSSGLLSAGRLGNARATRRAKNNAARSIQAHARGNAARRDISAQSSALERDRRMRERERRGAERLAARAAKASVPPPEPGSVAEREDVAKDMLLMAHALER